MVAVVQAEPAMCAHAFDVVSDALGVPPRGSRPGQWRDHVPNASGVGVFVTFNERAYTSDEYATWRLRGCIGTLSPTNLRPALSRYAKYSAFEDTRFDAITAKELPNLQAAVSVLSDFRKAPGGVYDWTVGVHGIILELSPYGRGGRTYSATYLPEICEEQGWTKERCIESLARKSGYRGEITDVLLDTAALSTYVSTKAALTYEEYCNL